jgi:hypothetical protein
MAKVVTAFIPQPHKAIEKSMKNDLGDTPDQRQYRLMSEQLRLFHEGKLCLGRLVTSLKGLASALKFTDQLWKDAFTNKWGTLEIVYAMALSREEAVSGSSPGEIDLTKDELSFVVTSVKNLHLLIPCP